MPEAYVRVRLLTDRFQSEGLQPGAFGYIIEVYPGGEYEVEFSQTDGTTIAQVVLTESEFAVDEPAQ